MKPQTIEDIEARIKITNDEILQALSQSHPLLVQATAENLQNQKMKSLLAELVDEPEED